MYIKFPPGNFLQVLPASPTISLFFPTSFPLPPLNECWCCLGFHPCFAALFPPAPFPDNLAHSQCFSCHLNGDDIPISLHLTSLITRLIVFHLYIMWPTQIQGNKLPLFYKFAHPFQSPFQCMSHLPSPILKSFLINFFLSSINPNIDSFISQ